MIKHIVLWKLKEEAEGLSKKENAAELKRKLEGLKSKISEIVELEVGLSFETSDAASDVALYSLFKNKEDLGKYQKHPEHQKIAEFVKSVVSERRVVDYEV